MERWQEGWALPPPGLLLCLLLPHSPGVPRSAGIHPPALKPALAAPFKPAERSKAQRRRFFVGDSVPRPLISQASAGPQRRGPSQAGVATPAHQVHGGRLSLGPGT